jgi:hypothetical protein
MMMTKTKFKTALLLSAGLMAGFSMAACNDDDETDSGADPVIRYFRPTDAAKADSMIVDLSLGQTVAMIGENLDNIIGMKFNDQEIALNPCYVTPTAVIFTTPVAIPGKVTNMLYLTCKNGKTVEYPTETLLPAPVIENVSKGFLKAGDVVTIKGNYFIPTADTPIEISLPGGVTVAAGESSTYTTLTFTVPDGISKSGSLSVSSAFGATNWPYDMIPYDDLKESRVEGLLIDFDGKNGAMAAANGWRPGNAADPSVELSGKACLFDNKGDALEGDITGSWLEDNMTVNYWPDASSNVLTRVPVDNIENYAYQMEIFVENPWPAVCFAVQPTSLEAVSASNNNNLYYSTVSSYLYEPYISDPEFTTNGEWITLTMPLKEFTRTIEGKGTSGLKVDDLAGLTIRWAGKGSGDLTAVPKFQPKLYFDNVRLVKSKY